MFPGIWEAWLAFVGSRARRRAQAIGIIGGDGNNEVVFAARLTAIEDKG